MAVSVVPPRVICAAALAWSLLAAPARPEPLPPVRLWPADAPGALGAGPNDVPKLTPWLARGAGPHPAIVVLPGGGYAGHAPHEGPAYAAWLQTNGISAFVATYRLGSRGYRHPCMWQDAARAVRIVRARAAEWNVDPRRVGVMGSSAGGHLAATLLTQFDDGSADADDPAERQSCRPDFGVLCYPVISLEDDIGHAGSTHQLLGDRPAPSLRRSLSAHLNVTSNTPPVFLWSLDKDPVVNVENSLRFATALSARGVPFELHVYAGDRHGTGLKNYPVDDALHPWTAALFRWLRLRGILPVSVETPR